MPTLRPRFYSPPGLIVTLSRSRAIRYVFLDNIVGRWYPSYWIIINYTLPETTPSGYRIIVCRSHYYYNGVTKFESRDETRTARVRKFLTERQGVEIKCNESPRAGHPCTRHYTHGENRTKSLSRGCKPYSL